MGFLLFIEVIVSILLVIVILLQRAKSTGMGTAMGGGAAESLFGVQAGNVLTRTTAILALIFLLDMTIMAFISSGRRDRSVTDELPAAVSTAAAPMAPAPQAGAGAAPSPVPGLAPTPAAVAKPADNMPAEATVPAVPVEAPAPVNP